MAARDQARWLPGYCPEERHAGAALQPVFAHACKLALEGIVSKRKNSAYRSGRSPDWLKMKNSDAPAVKRERRKNGADEPSQVRDQGHCMSGTSRILSSSSCRLEASATRARSLNPSTVNAAS